MKTRMGEHTYKGIQDYIKYKYCNCLNTCEDCIKNCHPYMCHVKVPLVDILKDLETERKRNFVEVED